METEIETRFQAVGGLLLSIEAIGLVFIALAVLETVWDVWRKQRLSLEQTLANSLIAVGNAVLERTLFGAVFVIALFVCEPLAPVDIPMTWWSWIAATLAADLTYYAMHRCEHKVRILWAYHSVHHSSPEFNLTTAFRLSWVEGLFEWLFFLPMILIGFDPVQTIGALVVVVGYQTWIHTEKIGWLGPLEGILNTPSAHRVHHTARPSRLDRNFGGILMIWDRLFGTYLNDRAPERYGLTDPVETANPIRINFAEYAAILRDMMREGSMKAALRHLHAMDGPIRDGKAPGVRPPSGA